MLEDICAPLFGYEKEYQVEVQQADLAVSFPRWLLVPTAASIPRNCAGRCMLLATSMLLPLRELLAGRAQGSFDSQLSRILAKLRENDEDFITKLRSAADTADTAVQPDEDETEAESKRLVVVVLPEILVNMYW